MAVKRVKKTHYNKKEFDIFADAMNLVVSIYIVLILGVMPLYFTDGYGRIGTNKYQFFYGVTVAMGLLFLFVLGIRLLFWAWDMFDKSKRENRFQKDELVQTIKNNMSLTDWFALGYGITLILSYLHTAYKGETLYGDAWTGSNGWYMGFSTQMLFLAIYFVVSRCWKIQKWVIFMGMITSFVVFVLGYCNRFSFYPIKMEYASSSFISTIGNINWFCGYLVTVFFGVLYYWWSDVEKKKWLRRVLIIYSVAGFGALVTQGSNSGVLALMIICVTFYLLSMKKGQKMQQFWLMMIVLGGTCSATMLLRYIFPESFPLEDTITNIFTYSIAPIAILVISIIAYVLVRGWNKKGKYPVKVFTWIGKIGVAAGVLLFMLLVVGIVVNTFVPGSLGKLSEFSIFTFNEVWGSKRGATYMAGIQTWLDQDMLGKLVGVGPDCMAMYVHGGSNPELQAMVQDIWGSSTMLTNAHCEWLTIMINMGVLGLIGFAGMIVSAITRFVRAGKSNVFAAACGISILAYTVNNVVSFQQAMATTTMFLILGIGEAFMRKQEDK